MTARCPFLEQLEQMPRLTEARYADGLGELYAQTDPMEVARKVFAQDGDMPNSAGLSTLFTTWGQFLDHDLSLTPEDEDDAHIAVDGFVRDVSRSEALDGTGETSAREFGNAITWQIDGSQIYGSNDVREADVRSFEGGKLKMIDDPTSTHGLLPLATEETVMAGDTSGDDAVFLAGDIRASENPNLLSLHTLFAREHNYWAERLAEEHPDWTDQDLFEVARSIVEYELQAITYDEWLPHLLGNAVPEDIPYDPDVDGQVSLEFSTAAFRFGHTMVSGHMPRLNEDGSIFGEGHLELLDTFFNPEPVKEGGIDGLLRGQAALHAQELDTKVIDDLNFFLATADGLSGFSLPALNLVRGADHGMGSYLDVRAQLLGDIDLSAIDPNDFSVITSDPSVQEELASVYDTVFDVDLWVGGLAEDKADGAQTGPTFTFILSDQFYRTAAADQSFGELDPRLSDGLLQDVKDSGLQDVILRNTEIDHLQDDPFKTAPRELTFLALIEGTADGDDIALTAVETDGDVDTGDGDDVATITGGSNLGGQLALGTGADKVFMSSGEVRADIEMGRGGENEVVDLSGTAVIGGSVQSGSGNDVVRMEDVAHVSDDIVTRAGNDRVMMSGKATVEGDIRTGSGSDEVTLSHAASAGVISTGGGDDIVLLLDGSKATFVDGGSGEDILTLGARAFRIEPDGPGDGRVFFLDESGAETGEALSYRNFEVVGGEDDPTDEDDLSVGTHAHSYVNALGGNDTLYGLSGMDRLEGGTGDDVIDGGAGIDLLLGQGGSDTIEGGGGRDRLVGHSGEDALDGGNGDDTLFGGTGDDSLTGGAGDDRMTAGKGADIAFGNSGNDAIFMSHGDDTAYGGSGNDLIHGGSGDDELRGGGGEDTLIAGGGVDRLTGGDGEDRFEADTSRDGTVTISDYSEGDLLALARMNDEEVIDILTGGGDGNDVIITSGENANWRIVLEDVEDFDEDAISYI
ncbi:MAG: peroxidase family protein [Pseudomonadota bacterium]